ncbi:MAG: isopentenyl-diphosphate Delta-isomerase [Rhodobacteraceae bacterium]|nr:isopentenyl-diphosphate Delta-isomerase [Paracoccaceae bacterium]
MPAWIDGTLAPVDKLEVHRRGLRHPAVSVCITAGDRVLLQRRARGKYHSPGLWANACCTHPAWGEAPAACAGRRLAEELGLEGLALTHRGQVEYRAEVGAGMVEHEVVDLFRAEAGPDLAPRPDPAEVMGLRWLTRAALAAELARAPGRFAPWLAIYLARHEGAIFGP